MRRRSVGIVAAVLACAPLGGCEAVKLGIAGHAGLVAEQTWHLYLIVGAVLIFVAGPVLLLVPAFAWHYRLSNKRSAYRPDWDFAWWVEGLIWLPPAGIVIGLAVVLWHYTHQLDPYRQVGAGTPIEVQAVGLDWKWLFIYPDEGIATVNQLAIPTGRPVRISLTSGTVMQSFLVPRLAGQIYAMAGMRTELNLAASRPGVYGGRNTQFNGMGFQKQLFDVVALDPAGYRRWLARVHAAPQALDGPAVDRLFARSVPAAPQFYSRVPPKLFAEVMRRSQEPVR